MNFDKVKLILAREYWTRVRKKTFLISTILTPLSIIGLGVLSGYLSSGAMSKSKSLLVNDSSGIIEQYVRSSNSLTFEFTDESLESMKGKLQDGSYTFALIISDLDEATIINEADITILGNEKPGIVTIESVQNRLEAALKKHNTKQAGYDQNELDQLNSKVSLQIDVLGGDGEEKEVSNASIAIGSVLGGLMGFMMYIILLVYGSFVMRSVMEEKINRIVEVVISSVRPFELMLGKILGVGLVGLTQIVVWVILIGAGMLIVTSIFGVGQVDTSEIAGVLEEVQASSEGFSMAKFLDEMKLINWPLIIVCFTVFFFGGYFIYASMFAAVGSAIGDDMTEGQSLTLPIMAPIIISILMLYPTIEDPHGPLAVFGSIFPLTSPILMPTRAAFDPPLWHVLISIVLLIVSCLFFVWLSGKIYRAGILLYGKKLSMKNLWQIIRN